MAEEDQLPLTVEIYSLLPDNKPPERASIDVRGSLPSRAVQLCPPVTAASSFGWYVFPPADFALRWDGQHTEWSLLGDNEPTGWRSLAGGYDALLPGAAEYIGGLPERFRHDIDIFERRGGAPPFLDADPRAQNTIEVTTGTVARTPPGWWLLARAVPNWPQDRGVQILDGLVESDWYRSTIPTIVRLTEPHRVVRFYREFPLMVLQPVHRSTIAALGDASLVVASGLAEWPPDVWAEFVEMRRRREDPDSRGTYRREQRRRNREVSPENAG